MILVLIIIVLIISVYYGPFVITHNGSNKLFPPTNQQTGAESIISISTSLSLKQRVKKMNKARIVSV